MHEKSGIEFLGWSARVGCLWRDGGRKMPAGTPTLLGGRKF